MPELPEVETTRRALAPICEAQTIRRIRVHDGRLRWPVPEELPERFAGQTITELRRRSKYLLIDTAVGSLILHLGMSGSLCHLPVGSSRRKHDHIDIELGSGRTLRLHDPRRFGALLWAQEPEAHKLLVHLGPEPLELSADELADHLHLAAHGRRIAVKNFIMNADVVVGVGNIYANEALFLAGIRPSTQTRRLSRRQWRDLAVKIQQRLRAAIDAGGTTLKDFQTGDGKPGYFAQELAVYGRTGEPCLVCSTPIKQQRHNQRSSFYCPSCQH